MNNKNRRHIPRPEGRKIRMTRITDSKSVLLAGASALAMSLFSGQAIAQDDSVAAEVETEAAPRTLETVVVTTQKRSESIQDVPIAVSAFDPENLDRLNINTGSDLQFNIPNFQSSQGNFSAGSISIRGIVNAAVGASSDDAVGTHINGVPSSGSYILETELFDVERVEILRGPQGTLYGRNATGGVLNAVTAKPNFDEYSGNLEASYGEYNSQKLTGHVNIPIGDDFGVRLAGFALKRDGFSDAILPDGSKQDVDGRDLSAFRATIGGDFSEDSRFWLMYETYEEDSTRTRSTKQLCTKDTRPFPFNQGCTPYQTSGIGYARDANGNPIQVRPGFGTVNTSGTLGGVLAANLGFYSAFGTDSNAGNTTSTNLREFETNLVPTFESEQQTITGEFQKDFDNNLTLTLLGSHNDSFRSFADDYNKGIGSVNFNVTGLTPDLDGDGDGDFPGYTAITGQPLPIDTGMRIPSDTLLATDISASDFVSTSFEGRLQSDFDGPFNFTVGALSLRAEGNADYYVFFNLAEAVAAISGLPADRSYFRSNSPYELDAKAAFGEVYYNMTDDFKWTLGLRYTDDQKTQKDTPVLLLSGIAPGQIQGEYEAGPAQEAQFQEVTGRFGFDWKLGEFGPADESLLYAFVSRGYKGGGINPPQSDGLTQVSNSFDPEFINAFEVGTKSTLFDGAAQMNLAAFYYDYQGYQISSIVNRSSINENVDAEVTGFEAEIYWQMTDNFRVDTTLGLLSAKLKDQALLDTYDQTGGDPNWLIVKDAATTQNCVASAAGVSALLASPFASAAGLICNPAGLNALIAGLSNQATADALTPALALDGIPTDVSGNFLPRAPETTISVGAQYELGLGENWSSILRGDFYYQADMYSRIFNLEADKIDSWQNANASLTFINDNAGIEVELYVKNLLEDDQITSQYLTDASSGLFTNVFLLEPRQFGIRIGKSW
jgi:outer membrane receptor protein involved in Fe transport